jgi:peptidoglycan/xylan/chitin deacetylase (PgdA/CDA1 family)
MRTEHGRSLLLVGITGATALHACTSAPPTSAVTATAEPVCANPAAFIAGRVHGTSLAPHTLALTFDDGPAARTSELAAYLESQGIEAGFFVNGSRVGEWPGVAAELVARGHMLGNHTHLHQDLRSRVAFPVTVAGDAALVASVEQTDALIAPYLHNGRRLFRAPYGSWDGRAFTVLEASAMNGYVGPIEWEIGDSRTATTAADWACWQNAPALSTKQCGDLYMAQITAVDRGIVLLHDAAYGDEANHALTTGVGNTVDMVKYLVPQLKAAGFAFVRVDHVPAIEAQLPPLRPSPPPPPLPPPPPPPPPQDAEAAADAAAPPPATGDRDASSSSPSSSTPNPFPTTPPRPVPPPVDDPCASSTVRPRREHAH